MAELFFRKIAVLGVGLIGASFSLAARKGGLCSEIAGFGRNEQNLIRAKDRGIIDYYEMDPSSACMDADLIVFAVPVGAFYDIVQRCRQSFKSGAVVTDVGSVKGGLVYRMEESMPEGVHYIGGHPIAGSDQSGIDSSDENLFRNEFSILTPTQNSHQDSLAVIRELWESLGSKVVLMDPKRHDRIYAAVSHLPHLIAYALVNTVAEIDGSCLEYSGQGFKDTTRIASSSYELWRDICLLNKDNLTEMITVFQKNLNSLGQYLRASDSSSLEAEFRKARTLREGIGQD